MGRALVAASSLAIVAALSDQPLVSAASTCVWVPADAELIVTVDLELDDDRLIVDGSAILLNGEECDPGATTSTVDTISVSGGGSEGPSFIVDQSGGAFAPGAEVEASGLSEIEFVLDGSFLAVEFQGGSGDDVISVGAAGANVDDDDDVDVTMSGDVLFTPNGRAGNDTLVGTGDAVVGGPLPHGFHAIGGLGNDLLVGSPTFNVLWGGGGSDHFIGGPGGNYVEGGRGDDLIVGGGSSDQLSGNRGDDTLIGRAGRDQLGGGRDDDVIRGVGGRDLLIPGPGNDLVDGGWGHDEASYRLSAGPVFVDLRTGSALGGPSVSLDTLLSIETIDGTRRGDKLAGGAGDEGLYGWGGPDVILGRRGRDYLDGGGGDDVLRGGPGADRLFGDVGVDALFGGPGIDRCVQLGHTGSESSCER